MNIVFIGGTGESLVNFRFSLAKQLVSEGHQIYAAFLSGKVDFAALDFVDTIELKNGRKGGLIQILRNALELNKFVILHKIDIMLSYTHICNLTSAITGLINPRVRCIYWVTGLGKIFLDGKLRFKILRVILRLFYQTSLIFHRKIIFQNPIDPFDLYYFIPSACYRYIIDGALSTFNFKREFNRLNRGGSTSAIFGYLGRLTDEKGSRELLEATKILKGLGFSNWSLCIAAHDLSESASLNEVCFISTVESRVSLLSHLDSIHFYGKVEWVVIPSYREGSSRVLWEALSYGLSVIVTDVVGCRQQEAFAGNFLWIRPGSPTDLAIAIIYSSTLRADIRFDDSGVRLRELFDVTDRKVARFITSVC